MKYNLNDLNFITPLNILQHFNLTNKNICRNILVSNKIFYTLQSSSGFAFNIKPEENDCLTSHGSISIYTIYVENDNYLKDLEYVFFDDIEGMKYKIKTKDRQAKLERIINES